MNKNNYKYTEEEVQMAYSTSVVDLASQRIPLYDEGKVYRVPDHGGLFLFKHGTGYYRWTDDEKGTGIDFLVRYCGFETKQEAIGAVLNNPGRIIESTQYIKSEEIKGEFLLPEKSKDFSRIYWYLLSKRCLDKEIVYKLINEKKIYQEAEKGNCVFVGYDKYDTAKYATKRGTSDIPYKGEVANSDKYVAFHINGEPESRRVYVTESPIDAISHASLMKLHGKRWNYDHHISLGCTSDRALKRFLEENQQITTIVFALDNDKNSEINHGQEAAEKYIKKYTELGYNCLNHIPISKDFNEDLIDFLKAAEEETAAEMG